MLKRAFNGWRNGVGGKVAKPERGQENRVEIEYTVRVTKRPILHQLDGFAHLAGRPQDFRST